MSSSWGRAFLEEAVSLDRQTHRGGKTRGHPEEAGRTPPGASGGRKRRAGRGAWREGAQAEGLACSSRRGLAKDRQSRNVVSTDLGQRSRDHADGAGTARPPRAREDSARSPPSGTVGGSVCSPKPGLWSWVRAAPAAHRGDPPTGPAAEQDRGLWPGCHLDQGSPPRLQGVGGLALGAGSRWRASSPPFHVADPVGYPVLWMKPGLTKRLLEGSRGLCRVQVSFQKAGRWRRAPGTGEVPVRRAPQVQAPVVLEPRQ